ncbi:MAG TPA: COQ9 family protein [Stellaceae bacterium]|nr:COQ9 family protein [Stellaceae bacterium]
MRDAETMNALLQAILPEVPFDGWTTAAMRKAAERMGLDPLEFASHCPGGPRDLVAEFSHWADRETLRAVEPLGLSGMKVRERVATGVRMRLSILAPHREAVRRALSLLAAPQNLALGARLLYDAVDALWYAAGDTATDFNFYTKRGLLAGVYAATTLYWLDDRSPDFEATHAFLDRRLADVMGIPKLGSRVREFASRLPDPFLFVRLARRR